MSYLSEYMQRDEITQNVINILPSDEHIKITVNRKVTTIQGFIEFHCNHKVEEASITFASGLILGYGPDHHCCGWKWGVSLLPSVKIDRSYINETIDTLHVFNAKVDALRDFIRWIEIHKGLKPAKQYFTTEDARKCISTKQ